MADFTIKAWVLPHLDGEGIQVIEHHVVGLREQRWVTLMMNRTAIYFRSEQSSRVLFWTHRDARVLVEQHLQQVRR